MAGINKIMKILQVVTQMEAGGAQRVALLLAEGFRERGYDEQIWCFYVKRPIYSDSQNVYSFFNRRIAFPGYFTLIYKLFNLIKQKKPEIMITHTHYANVVGQLIAFLCRVPCRIAVYHSPVDTYPQIARLADRSLIILGIIKIKVCVSNVVVKSMGVFSRCHKKDSHIIYNGIPIIIIDTSKEYTRSKWQIPSYATVIVSSGRLSKSKNQFALLKAMKHLTDTHLVIIGDGELREELFDLRKKLSLKNKVTFVGEISWHEAMQVIKASDIFVFPSIYESMGLAMVEAMQLGLPVIASNIPALRETAGDAALYIEPDNPMDIVNAVNRIRNNQQLAEKMSQRSKQVAARFNVKDMVESYERLIKTTIDKR